MRLPDGYRRTATMHLTKTDLAVLESLAESLADSDGATSLDRLAAEVDESPAALRERLEELTEAGVVGTADGGYELTPSGRRVLRAPASGAADDQIDTPPSVERAIAEMDLRADREGAVRKAFAVVYNRGKTTADAIVDAVYDENPAGYDDPDRWWETVREGLATIADHSALVQEECTWRYPSDDDADGRSVLEE